MASFFDKLTQSNKRFIASMLLILAGMYFIYAPDLIPDVAGVSGFIDDIIFLLGALNVANRWLIPRSR